MGLVRVNIAASNKANEARAESSPGGREITNSEAMAIIKAATDKGANIDDASIRNVFHGSSELKAYDTAKKELYKQRIAAAESHPRTSWDKGVNVVRDNFPKGFDINHKTEHPPKGWDQPAKPDMESRVNLVTQGFKDKGVKPEVAIDVLNTMHRAGELGPEPTASIVYKRIVYGNPYFKDVPSENKL